MHESDKLNDHQKLSQLMDGEWHDLNPADCVANLCADEALRAKWARFHMIRDALKSEPVHADTALASRICDAIKDEPSYSNITPFSGTSALPIATVKEEPVVEPPVSAPVESRPSWVNTGVAGFALAASVALVTVVGLNLFQQTDQASVSVVAGGSDVATPYDQGDEAVLPVVDFVANTGSFWMSPASSRRVSDEQRLNMMLSRHIENSPTSVREGLLPYSRLVGYEENTQSR
ncbi:MAG: sigma-E factor negative regulatory protein [Granulosicoccus sp.]